MLQQTRVDTVLGRYEAFLRRFPDVHALAAAPLDAVLAAWEGLGYYRRARLMHAAARRIVAHHGGAFPGRFEDIAALPGVGRSTAGAIASIAFGIARPVLDGNVRRVLGRWAGAAPPERALWRQAQDWIERAADAGDWNQAMMELGATVCLPRAPRCDACPAREWCRARGADAPAARAARSPTVRELHWRVRLHFEDGRGIWLVRRPARGIWAGLWTPPIEALRRPPERAPDCVHRLTHRRLLLYAAPCARAPDGDGCWSRELRGAVPTGIRRLLAAVGWEDRL